MEPENSSPIQAQPDQRFSQQQLQINKKEMLRIMKQAPIAGVYIGQDQKHWHTFYQSYIDFLKSQIGPRGQCSKAVRAQLAKDPKLYDEVLSLFNMSHKSHIRDIYVRYKSYTPCKQYDQLNKFTQALQKNEDGYTRIMDDKSIMYNTIKQGMIGKRGQDYDYKTQIQGIRTRYRQKIISLKQTVKQLQQQCQKNDNYLRYIRIKQVMKPFFAMWKQADMRIGYQSIQKGDQFQKIVRAHILPLIIKRSNLNPDKKYKIQTNCRWNPRNLGQIDIAIITYNKISNKWQAQIMIQCKSRLFDIRQAYKQVTALKQKGKQKLCTSIGIIDIVQNPKYFIVTTLPQFPFNLPIQSLMKQALEKSSKNTPIEDLKSQDMYPYVKKSLQEELSPLDWFLQNDSDHIIVLKYN